MRGEDTKSLCYTLDVAFAPRRKAATAGKHCLSLPQASPGKGFLQPGAGSGCSCFWEWILGAFGVGIVHGCWSESSDSSSEIGYFQPQLGSGAGKPLQISFLLLILIFFILKH